MVAAGRELLCELPPEWSHRRDYLGVVATRRTLPLDPDFNRSNPGDQRVYNWTANNDEIHDFENNTRGVQGGHGAIVDATDTPISLTTGLVLDGGGFFTDGGSNRDSQRQPLGVCAAGGAHPGSEHRLGLHRRLHPVLADRRQTNAHLTASPGLQWWEPGGHRCRFPHLRDQQLRGLPRRRQVDGKHGSIHAVPGGQRKRLVRLHRWDFRRRLVRG